MAVLTPSSLVNQSLASADDIVVVIERLHQHQQNRVVKEAFLLEPGLHLPGSVSIHHQ
jgi:hypothetical protein